MLRHAQCGKIAPQLALHIIFMHFHNKNDEISRQIVGAGK